VVEVRVVGGEGGPERRGVRVGVHEDKPLPQLIVREIAKIPDF
jgi:hypothetical protein